MPHHFRASLEDHAFVYHEAGSNDVPAENRRPVNFHPVLCNNVPNDLAANDNGSGLDFTFNPRPLTHNKDVVGEDLSLECTADANRPLKTKLSFEFTAMLDDSADGVIL